jgi:hypothetical protein
MQDHLAAQRRLPTEQSRALWPTKCDTTLLQILARHLNAAKPLRQQLGTALEKLPELFASLQF